MQVFEQFGGLAVNLGHLFRQLVADAGFDQDVLVPGAHQHGIQSGGDQVVLIRRQLFRPQGLGHNAKIGAAVETVNSIGKRYKLEVADGDRASGRSGHRLILLDSKGWPSKSRQPQRTQVGKETREVSTYYSVR